MSEENQMMDLNLSLSEQCGRGCNMETWLKNSKLRMGSVHASIHSTNAYLDPLSSHMCRRDHYVKILWTNDVLALYLAVCYLLLVGDLFEQLLLFNIQELMLVPIMLLLHKAFLFPIGKKEAHSFKQLLKYMLELCHFLCPLCISFLVSVLLCGYEI